MATFLGTLCFLFLLQLILGNSLPESKSTGVPTPRDASEHAKNYRVLQKRTFERGRDLKTGSVERGAEQQLPSAAERWLLFETANHGVIDIDGLPPTNRFGHRYGHHDRDRLGPHQQREKQDLVHDHSNPELCPDKRSKIHFMKKAPLKNLKDNASNDPELVSLWKKKPVWSREAWQKRSYYDRSRPNFWVREEEPSHHHHHPSLHPEDDGGGTLSVMTQGLSKEIANQFIHRSPRGKTQYDVPQIECPPSEDGMERFACPTPDRMGRYRCIDDHVLCDGFIDCPTGEDEDRQSCMFYKTTKAHLDVLADALLRWARGR
nr:PREDICTED: uncharacterized protein LOC109037600 [Bemisia tabaci]